MKNEGEQQQCFSVSTEKHHLAPALSRQTPLPPRFAIVRPHRAFAVASLLERDRVCFSFRFVQHFFRFSFLSISSRWLHFIHSRRGSSVRAVLRCSWELADVVFVAADLFPTSRAQETTKLRRRMESVSEKKNVEKNKSSAPMQRYQTSELRSCDACGNRVE